MGKVEIGIYFCVTDIHFGVQFCIGDNAIGSLREADCKRRALAHNNVRKSKITDLAQILRN